MDPENKSPLVRSCSRDSVYDETGTDSENNTLDHQDNDAAVGHYSIVNGGEESSQHIDPMKQCVLNSAESEASNEQDSDALILKNRTDEGGLFTYTSTDHNVVDGDCHDNMSSQNRRTVANEEVFDREDGNYSEIIADDGDCNQGNTEEQYPERDPKAGLKKVAWLLDHETALFSASVEDAHTVTDHADTDIMGNHSDIDTAGQLYKDSLGISTSAGMDGKEVKEHSNSVNSSENTNITPREGGCFINEGLNAPGDKEATQTENRLKHSGSVSGNGPSRSGSECEFEPVDQEKFIHHRLITLRPFSASGALTRTRRLLDPGESVSLGKATARELCTKPNSSPERRRFSLPVDFERSSTCQRDHVPLNESHVSVNLLVHAATGTGGCMNMGVNGDPKAAFMETPVNQPSLQKPPSHLDASQPSHKPPKPTHSSARFRQRPHSSPVARQTSSSGRSGSRPTRPSTAMGTPRTWEIQITKEELRRALPRRSFFSCHTQALKDAGYEVKDDNNRRRRRHFFFNHPEITEVSASNQPSTSNPSATNNQPGPAMVAPTIKEPVDQDTQEKEKENKENVQENSRRDSIVKTAVRLLSFADRAKRRRTSIMPQQPQVVECKPLQEYLCYVRDNPAEYHQMIAKTLHTPGSAANHHVSCVAATDPATIHLVQMGRAFQERNAGGQRADDVIRAAYALRPRSADPNRFTKLTREKSPLLTKRESTVSALGGGGGGPGLGGGGVRGSKPGSEDHRRRQEAESKAAAADQMTEMEKRRQRAEEWTKSVTTEQLVCAKVHVLKELGHEEHELSKWWLAFRDCYYIRPKAY